MRRKALISAPLRSEDTFEEIMLEFKKRFHALSAELQEEAQRVVMTHLEVIRGTLDMVRDENVAQESERDSEFRVRVADEVGRVQIEIARIRERALPSSG